MTRIERIKNRLKTLHPKYLQIVDQSINHADHFEEAAHGQTHLAIDIWSDVFINISTLKQHKMIKELIADEFNSGLHALTINILKNYKHEN